MDERHRHRYEVNPTMVEQLEAKGLRFVGKDETGQRMEIVELTGHPYFVASQFHPEFKSRPGKASPLFLGLILAASGMCALPVVLVLLLLLMHYAFSLGKYCSDHSRSWKVMCGHI